MDLAEALATLKDYKLNHPWELNDKDKAALAVLMKHTEECLAPPMATDE